MKKQIKGLNTMKKIFAPLTAVALMMSGCDIDKAINDNPNDITLSDVDARLFLNGAQLANFTAQVSHVCLLYTSPSPRDATLSRMAACG